MLAEIVPKIAGMTQRENSKYQHRCSSASYGDKCLRGQVYHSLGIQPKPFADRFVLVLDDSSWHEQLSADWIRKSGYKLHSEQMEVMPFSINGKEVKGHIDGIITDLQDNDILYEHKAINHFTFTAYETGDLLPYDYIAQCCSYIVGLEKDTGKLLPGILLVKNKNTSRFCEYHIEYDVQEDIAKVKLFIMSYDQNEEGTLKEVKEFFMEKIIETIMNRFQEIDKYTLRKTLPIRQYDIDNWHCEYCRWAGHCYKNYEEEIDKRKAEIKITDKKIIELAKQCYDIVETSKTNKKVVEDLKLKLKMYMQEQNAQIGKFGNFYISMQKIMRKNLIKSMIPQELLDKATKKTASESLSVKKFKGGKDD